MGKNRTDLPASTKSSFTFCSLSRLEGVEHSWLFTARRLHRFFFLLCWTDYSRSQRDCRTFVKNCRVIYKCRQISSYQQSVNEQNSRVPAQLAGSGYIPTEQKGRWDQTEYLNVNFCLSVCIKRIWSETILSTSVLSNNLNFNFDIICR